MKIFGNGFIGKNLKKANLKFNDNYIVYAAGISNSKISSRTELLRERLLIKRFIKKHKNNKIIIYISTMSIFDKSLKKNAYVKNKIFIENYIKINIKNFLIIRLTQIVGRNKNPNTITNFFYNKIKNKKFFKLWDKTYRNLIDIDDLITIFKNILKKKFKKKNELNIYNTKSISSKEIVLILSKILNLKPNYKLIRFRKNINYIYKKNSKSYQFAYLFNNKNYNKDVLTKYYK